MSPVEMPDTDWRFPSLHSAIIDKNYGHLFTIINIDIEVILKLNDIKHEFNLLPDELSSPLPSCEPE